MAARTSQPAKHWALAALRRRSEHRASDAPAEHQASAGLQTQWWSEHRASDSPVCPWPSDIDSPDG